MTRAAAVSLVAAAVVVALLVVVGRWERERRAERHVAGMQTVLEAIGPLESPSLHGFRVLPRFDCLVYERPPNPYALELCVDDAGRVVEAIDRRDERRIWSLRDDPARARLRVDRRRVDELLRGLGVPDRFLPTRGRGGS